MVSGVFFLVSSNLETPHHNFQRMCVARVCMHACAVYVLCVARVPVEAEAGHLMSCSVTLHCVCVCAWVLCECAVCACMVRVPVEAESGYLVFCSAT